MYQNAGGHWGYLEEMSMTDSPTEDTLSASADPSRHPPGSIEWLVAILRRLLGPGGCPWDREQTLDSIKHYLLEEAYEVCEAIEEGDSEHHCEELGDVLYLLIFQAELGGLELEQVIRGAGEKLIRRHPHVFGDAQVDGTDQVLANWEMIKKAERGGKQRGLLSGVPMAMPALQRAHRLTERAAKVGFDWPDAAGARSKVIEELGELDHAAGQDDREAMGWEVGDLLFAVVNWARKLGLEPEEALRRATGRFIGRFSHIEDRLAEQGREPTEATLEEMDRLWEEAKGSE